MVNDDRSSDKPINVVPVVLCGGLGTRLWPLSRAGFPKQFLCLAGEESLFQQAVARLLALGSDRITVAAPYVVTNEEQRFLVSEQLREVGVELAAALLEPTGRNTAPALTLAALAALGHACLHQGYWQYMPMPHECRPLAKCRFVVPGPPIHIGVAPWKG